MSLNAPDPQPWYIRRYAIKLHLSRISSHLLARTMVDHCAPARRYAGTQPGTVVLSCLVEVPRSARPINSILPQAAQDLARRLCPVTLPCPCPSIKGSLLPHQITTARRSETTTDVRSTLEETHPGHTFNLSRVHQPPSERCVASPLDCDAIRYDVMPRAGKRRQAAATAPAGGLELRSVGRVVPCLPFSRVRLLLCPIVCPPY